MSAYPTDHGDGAVELVTLMLPLLAGEEPCERDRFANGDVDMQVS